MQHKLIDYFKKLIPLEANEIAALVESMEILSFKKNEIIIREGQLATSTYFVLNGCVKQFGNIDGKEMTTNFFTEEQWIISLDNFEENKPSQYSLMAIEDTELVVGNEKKHKNYLRFFLILKMCLVKLWKKFFSSNMQD
jgi:CRP-like cAMP-binding protein